MPYLRRVYRLPAELEEPLVADLWQSGTLGVSTENEPDGRLRLTAWFEAGAPGPAAHPGAETLPTDLPSPIECLSEDEQPDVDWMAEYRRQAVPFPLGRTLWIDPREPEPAAAAPTVPAGRRLLRLPARTAFGIGSHESTALALELLEASEVAGRSVLDVGTGTGVLAFAALARGAARVVAFDADPVAAFQARANSRLNGLRPLLFAGRAAALAPRPAQGPAARFDLVVVNVVPEEIQPDLADLLPLLAPGGELVLSGLLAARAPEVSARLAALGLVEADARRCRGEWAALQLSWPTP
ncbi:MAG TPA: 50S ribosomal protein L11 methyltransferase [Thermoanaerobaculia bacterium]|jgi:ribosomal protein L11 methyltransferase|nr:50S ribosomal protein L11 methyltransferase [Thermoanaerobaculia bacterium]